MVQYNTIPNYDTSLQSKIQYCQENESLMILNLPLTLLEVIRVLVSALECVNPLHVAEEKIDTG